jgi:hypothetical protein
VLPTAAMQLFASSGDDDAMSVLDQFAGAGAAHAAMNCP